MKFITIRHKRGEITIRLEHIADIRKENDSDLIYSRSDKGIERIHQPYFFYVKVYDHIHQHYIELCLTEEKYISLLRELKTSMEEKND